MSFVFLFKIVNAYAFFSWAALVVPSMISILILPTEDVLLTSKYLGTWMIFTFPVLVTMCLAPGFASDILKGVAVGIVINVIFGLHQLICGLFGQTYPFLALFNYPQFNMTAGALQSMCDAHRPFGLFPEPSALAAALSPWIVLLLALGFRMIRFAGDLSPRVTAFFRTSGILGTLLILVSKSGHAAFLMLGLLFLSWKSLGRYLKEMNLIKMVFLILLLAAILWIGGYFLSQRMQPQYDPDGVTNHSWSVRFHSITSGLDVWLNGPLERFWLGHGGDSYRVVWQKEGSFTIGGVLFTFILDNGLFGLVVMFHLFCLILRFVKKSGFVLVGFVCFLQWLLAIAFTTSYGSLLSLWATLGWFLVWDKTIESRGRKC